MSATVVALIRGVGGRTALPMPALRAALEAAGAREVRTLQVAGNVVMDAAGHDPAACGELVRATVREAFGHDLPVLVRTPAQLRDATARNPYLGTQENRWVLTMFLDTAPDPAGSGTLDPATFAPDRFTLGASELFLRYESGVGTSRMQGAWFERRLGVIGTTRNANTIEKLIRLSERS